MTSYSRCLFHLGNYLASRFRRLFPLGNLATHLAPYFHTLFLLGNLLGFLLPHFVHPRKSGSFWHPASMLFPPWKPSYQLAFQRPCSVPHTKPDHLHGPCPLPPAPTSHFPAMFLLWNLPDNLLPLSVSSRKPSHYLSLIHI